MHVPARIVTSSIDNLTMREWRPTMASSTRGGGVRMPADSISTDELRQLLTSGQPVTVIDIRSQADRESSIPGSLHLDAYDAVKSGSLGPLANLDLHGPVVTVWGMGETAAKAT